MGKTIYLLRHAKSRWKDISVDDFDRPLNKRGEKASILIGEYIQAQKIIPEIVLCSPARRTRDTWKIIDSAMDAVMPVRFEKGIYLAPASLLLRRIRRLNDAISSVMIVGHNPGLQKLARDLVDAENEQHRVCLAGKFPTAALCKIVFELERWPDLRVGTGRLELFLTPKDLQTP